MQPEEQVQASQEAAAVLASNIETAKMKTSNIKKKTKQAVPNKGGHMCPEGVQNWKKTPIFFFDAK